MNILYKIVYTLKQCYTTCKTQVYQIWSGITLFQPVTFSNSLIISKKIYRKLLEVDPYTEWEISIF